MKYPPETYVRALEEVLRKTPGEKKDRIIKNFVRIIAKNGDLPQIKKINGYLEKISVKERGGRIIKLEFARTLPEKEISKIAGKFSEKDLIKTIINPKIVAGVRITVDDEKELDNSLEKKLKKLLN
jgi:F0F1-type ATP synthase delta subunit